MTQNNKLITLDTGASQHYAPSPIIYTLEFRSAWQKIVHENNNATQKKSKKRNRNHNRNRNRN